MDPHTESVVRDLRYTAISAIFIQVIICLNSNTSVYLQSAIATPAGYKIIYFDVWKTALIVQFVFLYQDMKR